MTHDNILRKKKIINILNKDKKLLKFIKNLQKLRKAGKTDTEILDIIKEQELPLKYHLFITGKYSDLMEIKLN